MGYSLLFLAIMGGECSPKYTEEHRTRVCCHKLGVVPIHRRCIPETRLQAEKQQHNNHNIQSHTSYNHDKDTKQHMEKTALLFSEAGFLLISGEVP